MELMHRANFKNFSQKTKLLDGFFSISIALFYSLFGGSLVTYDGRQYLATANSFLKGSLDSGYLFGRPPMYPFFLSVIFRFSQSDRFLIFVQVLLTAIAIIFLFRSLTKFFVAKSLNFTIPIGVSYLLIAAPTITGYGSTVLQQSLFVIEGAVMSALVLLIFINPTRTRLYIALILTIASTLLTGQGMIPFIFGILTSIVLNFALRIKQRKVVLWANLPIIFALLLVVPVTLSLWSSFEAWGKARPGAVNIGIPSGGSLLQYPQYFFQDPSVATDNLLEAYVTQSGLMPAIQAKGLIAPGGTDTYRFFENRVHAENVFLFDRSCGIIDTNYLGDWDRFSQGVLEQACSRFILPSKFQNLGYIAGVVISILSFLFVPIGLVLLYLVIRSRRISENIWLISLILPSVLLRGSYVFLGFQPDRYALPTIPLTVILIWISFQTINARFFGKKQKEITS